MNNREAIAAARTSRASQAFALRFFKHHPPAVRSNPILEMSTSRQESVSLRCDAPPSSDNALHAFFGRIGVNPIENWRGARGSFCAGTAHQVTAQSHEPRRTRSSAGIIHLQVPMVDDRYDDERQAHLAGAEYRGIHDTQDRTTGNKFAAENR
jgi:hypothetical protein